MITAQNLGKSYFNKPTKQFLAYFIRYLYEVLPGGRGGLQKRFSSGDRIVLTDVIVELKKGKHLGVIGPNGSGKSTLLAILAGILTHDKGTLTKSVRIGFLDGSFSNFCSELTVKENCRFLMMPTCSNLEINAQVERICRFAELEGSEDKLFRHLSSGQKMRLAFTLNIFLEPDVLILDEVFSVGDGAFRFKSWNELMRISERCTFVIATHSMSIVSEFCKECLVLESGKPSYYGDDIELSIEKYKTGCSKGGRDTWIQDADFHITSVRVPESVRFGGSFSLSFNLERVLKKEGEYHVVIKIFHPSSDYPVITFDSRIKDWSLRHKAEVVRVVSTARDLRLASGKYDVSIAVVNTETKKISGYVRKTNCLNLVGGPHGSAMVFHEFEFTSDILK